MKDKWEVVIGLEIHVQLNTKTKLFSPAPNQFGAEPNQNISSICTGQPGSLPLLNKEAVKKAVLFGLAVGAKIAERSTFDRKSYFYPDSPRNFQITQFTHPIIEGGFVEILLDGKSQKIAIQSAHLEDDAGTLKHFSSFSGVDDNRAGSPLIEVVSKPCMKTPKEASEYARAIRAIFQYIGASDANMELGKMRMDANVSVRLKGEKALRNKVEIKNMNSFHFLELAIEQEILRQIAIYEKDPEAIIPSSTCRFDPVKKSLSVMRTKERAADYRYMPEPDIPPVLLSQETIEEIKKLLPELPQARKKRYIEELKLSTEAASIITSDKALSDYFEKAQEFCTSAKMLCNWITVEIPGKLKDEDKTLISTGIPPEHLGGLIALIEKQTITTRMAKKIIDDMIKRPEKSPEDIIKGNADYVPLSDASAISPIVDQVLKDNPQSIIDFQKGRKKAFAFLVGQVMKQTKGKANPEIVNTLIHKKLDSNA